MAASELTVQQTSRSTGLSMAGAAANVDGNYWTNDGQSVLEIANAGVGSITLTMDLKRQVDGMDATDRTASVAAGARRVFGPFPTGDYNDANGRMNVAYSGVTDVTVTVFKLASG